MVYWDNILRLNYINIVINYIYTYNTVEIKSVILNIKKSIGKNKLKLLGSNK